MQHLSSLRFNRLPSVHRVGPALLMALYPSRRRRQQHLPTQEQPGHLRRLRGDRIRAEPEQLAEQPHYPSVAILTRTARSAAMDIMW
jgi:hypothetical protein